MTNTSVQGYDMGYSRSASKLQLLSICQYPFRRDALITRRPFGKAAAMGTSMHAMACAHLSGKPMPPLTQWTKTEQKKIQAWFDYWMEHFDDLGYDVNAEPAFSWNPDDGVKFLGYDIDRKYWANGAGPDDFTGSADIVLVSPDRTHAVVSDIKTGRHKQATAATNKQLAGLGYYVAKHFGAKRVDVELDYVQLRTKDRAPLDLAAAERMLLEAWANATPTAEPRKGSHCTALYCDAKPNCPAWQVEEKPRMKFDLSKPKEKQPRLRPCMAVFGPHGVGKSTFAMGAEAPFYIDGENSTREYDTGPIEDRGGRFEYPESWTEVMEMLDALIEQEHGFKTVVIDTMSELEKMAGRKVCQEGGKTSLAEFGFGKGYVAVTTLFATELLPRLKKLHTKGMAVVLLCHATMRKIEDPEGPGYNQYALKLHQGNNPDSQTASLIAEWVSELLFAKVVSHVTGEGGRAVSSGERILCTTGTPAFDAKNRSNLPATLTLPPDGGWQVYMAAREKYGSVENLKAAINEVAAQLPESTRERINAALQRDNSPNQLVRILNKAEQEKAA